MPPKKKAPARVDASSEFLRIVQAVLKKTSARSEPDLSTRLAKVFDEIGLFTVVDTGQGTRKRPDILCYLKQHEADLVLPAEIVVESKKPDELAGLTLQNAATGLLWSSKTVPYVKENLPRIRYFVLTTFVDFLFVPITPEIRLAFREPTEALLENRDLKRALLSNAVQISLSELATKPTAGEKWSEWLSSHFKAEHLVPVSFASARNTLPVASGAELETFAATLATIMAGQTLPGHALNGMFAAVRGALPDSFDELDHQTKQDLRIFTLASNPYTKDAEVLLKNDFLRWRDEFVAASVHSVISRLFTLKVIEDTYCVGRPDPLIEKPLWVVNSSDCDAHLEDLSAHVRSKIAALKGADSQVVQHLAVFGAFFDWIWLRLDPALFDTLFRLFVSSDFSRLDYDLLGRFFEVYSQAVNRSQRKELGQYYTPLPVVRFMWHLVMASVPEDVANESLTVLDPGMGSGTFLKEGAPWMAKSGPAFWRRMVGFDISAQVMGIAEANIYMAVLRELSPSEARGVTALRLFTTDSLDPRNGRFLKDIAPFFDDEIHRSFIESAIQVSATIKQKEHFCLVIGNPPYKNNSRITMGEVARRFPRLLKSSADAARAQKRNIRDDYAWFFAAADHYVSERGIVCFITSDSYTKKQSYGLFREELIRNYRLLALVNLGTGVFQDVSHRIGFCIIVLVKRKEPLKSVAKLRDELDIPYFDMRSLITPDREGDRATANDPRFAYFDKLSKENRLPKFVHHRPREEHGYSFMPIDEEGLVAKVLSARSVPTAEKDGDRIFLKKWPGVITAFDEFFRADSRADLSKRIAGFFAIATETGTKGRQRRHRIEEWSKLNAIENQSDRLESFAEQIRANRLTFDKAKIKRSFKGTIANADRWFPPADHHCFVYYEPDLSIERNTNEGKAKGWGDMGQWREPQSHTILPKLAFTTSQNPKAAYKAFIFREEWIVKLHGGTSQQYNYTGLNNPSQPPQLDFKPNNLAAAGERLYDSLESWNAGPDALLYYVAAIYNSELAQRFIDETTARGLEVILPDNSQRALTLKIIQIGRRLEWLHWAINGLSDAESLSEMQLPPEIAEEFWEQMGLKKEISSAKGYKKAESYPIHSDFRERMAETITEKQDELDSLVFELYGVQE